MSRTATMLLGTMLIAGAQAACTAPEEPAKPVRTTPAASTPAPNRANLEDAPIPNRRLREPGANSVIRVQQ